MKILIAEHRRGLVGVIFIKLDKGIFILKAAGDGDLLDGAGGVDEAGFDIVKPPLDDGGLGIIAKLTLHHTRQMIGTIAKALGKICHGERLATVGADKGRHLIGGRCATHQRSFHAQA